jgi:hypothetical protein
MAAAHLHSRRNGMFKRVISAIGVILMTGTLAAAAQSTTNSNVQGGNKTATAGQSTQSSTKATSGTKAKSKAAKKHKKHQNRKSAAAAKPATPPKQ